MLRTAHDEIETGTGNHPHRTVLTDQRIRHLRTGERLRRFVNLKLLRILLCLRILGILGKVKRLLRASARFHVEAISYDRFSVDAACAVTRDGMLNFYLTSVLHCDRGWVELRIVVAVACDASTTRAVGN